jgi:AcrR family transcriptional regulator
MSMERKLPDVKRKRRYDSRGRVLRAQDARRRIVDSARELFLRDGYAATTVARIADSAGVSVETVYKAFGGKPGLVQSIAEAALAGEGDVHAETRSDELHRTEPDPRAIIEGWGRLAREVAPRVSPILLLVRDAAADPDMLRLQARLDADRLSRMTHNARSLAEAGHLRADVGVEHAAEVMWTYSSPQVYELLVIQRGWAIDRYGRFVTDALIASLLPPDRQPWT